MSVLNIKGTSLHEGTSYWSFLNVQPVGLGAKGRPWDGQLESSGCIKQF